jgi:dienelactone hydrolase
MTASAGIDERALRIAAGAAVLHGDLRMPRSPAGLVLFAHGSGSSRRSVRNRFVAEILNDAGIATLLFDLLTEAEEAIDLRTRQLRFDIELLIRRLSMTTAWVLADDDLGSMPLGYFGASTGAAAALGASCEHPEVRAVVSRGGRPDLAGPLLGHVRAATLLIVGGDDYGVIELNEQALARLQCEARLEIVPGATHLFEEPGTLEQAARLAADWFAADLPAP